MNDNIKLYNLLGGETPSNTTDLPPPDTKRWVTRRKAVIVNAVRTGVISLEEVCRLYELSVEEFLAWETCDRHPRSAGFARHPATNLSRQPALAGSKPRC